MKQCGTRAQGIRKPRMGPAVSIMAMSLDSHVVDCSLSPGTGGLFSFFFFFSFFGEFFAVGHVHSPDGQRETERQKARNHPSDGMAMSQSLLFCSPLKILGTHAHVPGMSLCHQDPGLELRSTTWESRDIAIMPSAGPRSHDFSDDTIERTSVIS